MEVPIVKYKNVSYHYTVWGVIHLSMSYFLSTYYVPGTGLDIMGPVQIGVGLMGKPLWDSFSFEEFSWPPEWGAQTSPVWTFQCSGLRNFCSTSKNSHRLSRSEKWYIPQMGLHSLLNRCISRVSDQLLHNVCHSSKTAPRVNRGLGVCVKSRAPREPSSPKGLCNPL